MPAPALYRVIIIALVCACGDDDDGLHDADGVGDSPGDTVGQTSSVACGATSCTTPVQACCELPSPSTDYCYTATAICEGGRPMRCDGPEDCPTNELCCYSAGGGGSYCASAATCTANSGQVMCHGSCETGQCCPVGDGPYATCKPSC